MSWSRLTVTLAVGCLALAGCAPRTVVVRDRPGPSTAVTLGIPPGHLPPPGQCRIWIEGRPPGRQPRARSCNNILANAPAGAMVVYRPTRDRRIVRVRYIHARRMGVVIRVRVFNAESLAFIREEDND